MKATSTTRFFRTLNVVLSLAILVLILNALRHEADGFRNLFSLHYWETRRAGVDLYNPSENYLKRGSRTEQDVLLTFDDGPHPKSASGILDELNKEGVPAVFFVVGQRVKESPGLVRRMIAEGHEVGNHTQDHIRLDTLDSLQIFSQLRNCELNVERATGREMTLMRPPGMRFNKLVLDQAKALGYIMVGWNIGAKDFVPNGGVSDMTPEEAKALKCTPDIIAERVIKQLKNGTIILLHDNPVTMAALPEIIRRVRAEGYTFKSTADFMKGLPNPVNIVANPIPTTRVAHSIDSTEPYRP